MKVLRNDRAIQEYTPEKHRAYEKRRANRPPPSELPSRILEAIRAADLHGDVLSVREIQAQCNISSTSVVMYNLRRLALDGDLTLGARGRSRGYRLTPQGRGAPDRDTALFRRCLDYLERELCAVGGALIEDLRARLG